MKFSSRIATLAMVAAAMSAARSASADFTISRFNTDQQALVSGGPAGPKSAFDNSASATSVGGYRSMLVTRIGPATSRATVEADSNITLSSFFSYSSPAGVTGSVDLRFDGNNNSTTIDPNGLGGVDITEGGLDTGFLFRMVSDTGAPLTITAYSGANVSQATVAIPADPSFVPQLVFVPFAAFTTIAGSGANFMSIGALSFLVDGAASPGVDAQIDFIVTSAPEPSSLALVGLAGLGLAAMRRASRPRA
jgi:hypothetical protein